MSFDSQRIKTSGWVRHVELHETLPSTSDRALQRAGQADLQTPALVVALDQTAGRGRGTHEWWSSRGALLFSLVIDPAASRLRTELFPRVSLAVAVAICDTVGPLVGNAACGLRWPNDVDLAGRKLAGTLIEVPNVGPHAGDNVPRRLVIGVGLNVNNSLADAPEEIRRRGTSLVDQTGNTFDLTTLLLEFLARLEGRLDQLAAGDAALANAWQSLSTLAGREVEVVAGRRTARGTVLEIAADGALVLMTPTGKERLATGSITAIQ